MKQYFFSAKRILAVFFVAAFALCLTLGLRFALPETARAEESEQTKTPVATYVLGAESGDISGAVYYVNRVTGWGAAVADSLARSEAGDENTLVKVVLASDWKASGDAMNVTSFGTSEYFRNGRIYIPENADILLDLNGKVIDRNLTSAASSGNVIYVDGKLEIIDGDTQAVHENEYNYQTGENTDGEPVYTTVTGGIITGGFSNGYCGGIYVNGGSLTINAGTVFGNVASFGGGVYLAANSEFEMNGGVICNNAIKGNNSSNGAGVYVVNSIFTMYDGLIADNKMHEDATHGMNGGGVAVSSSNSLSSSFIMYNGKIQYNSSTSSGGGVYVTGTDSEFVFYNGEISRNSSNAGGALSVNAAGSKATLIGGKMTQNVARSGSGGGISIASGKVVLAENDGEEGVEICDNKSSSYGAGIYASNSATLEMQAGKVNNNISAQTGYIGGGGIFMNGTFELSGGEIKGNQTAATGGAIYVNSGSLKLSGSPVVENNKKSSDDSVNDIFINKAVSVVGEFQEGASLYFVTVGTTLTDYAKYNSANGYAVNPSEYFHSNNATYNTLLNSEGTVLFKNNVAVSWKVDGEEVADYGLAYTYGEKNISEITLNDGENLAEEIQNVLYNENGEIISYGVSGTVGSGNNAVKVKFEIRVNPKEIVKDNVSFAQSEVTFTGEEIKNPPTVKIGNVALSEERDYSVAYENNRNKGTATIVVTGKGNYSGTVTLNFTIKADTSKNYSAIIWEYLVDGEWTEEAPEFVYTGLNQNTLVRAKLTVGDITDYVYAQGTAPVDVNGWNNNLWLTFAGVFDGQTYSTFNNSAEYTVTLENVTEGNAAFAQDYKFTTTLTINPATLDITEDQFKASGAYKDAEGNRLWLVSFAGETSQLRDGADVVYSVNGVETQGDDKVDAYARYRGSELQLNLNQAYLAGQQGSIEVYLQSSTAAYTNNKVTGVEDAITEVTTTVVLTFNDNFVTSEGGSTITITKVWYVVTINNALVTVEGNEPPTVKGWVYGFDMDIVTLKPEHGDTAIYTFLSDGQIIRQFAVVFGENEISYFELTEDGEVDLNRPVVNENENVIPEYLNYYLVRLGAGNYTMRVDVPKYQGEDEIVYYPIVRQFNFTVTAYSIVDEEGNLNTGILYTVLSLYVSYNGQENNTPGLLLKLNDRTLVSGEDYELLCDRVDVGWTDLKVRGIGGLTGELIIPEAFEIIQTSNGWQTVPSIISWVYNNYNKEINYISAMPAYLDNAEDLWFKVTFDEEGEEVVEGLSKFNVADGIVSDDVAAEFAKLNQGTYYLFATVDGNDNYTELTPDGVQFNVFALTNAWITEPVMGGWNWGEFNGDAITIASTPVIGEVNYMIYYLNGNSKVFLKFDDKQNFVPDVNGKLPKAVSDVLKNLNQGTYYLAATVLNDANGNYNGLSREVEFRIVPLTTTWVVTPNVIAWQYDNYDKDTNLILASASSGAEVTFKITDKDGADKTGSFKLKDGKVSDEIAKVLNGLNYGTYYLEASTEADENLNYSAHKSTVQFAVSRAVNGWTTAPTITSWVTGKFDESVNKAEAQSAYGEVHIVISDSENKVVYDNLSGVNKLASAGVGSYILTASVDGDADYYGLQAYSVSFSVFASEGLHWWAILLIVLGALAVVALVLFILHQKGVLQMLSGKVIIAMRTRATVDATIAAVRANKVAERAKITVAEAEAREAEENKKNGGHVGE